MTFTTALIKINPTCNYNKTVRDLSSLKFEDPYYFIRTTSAKQVMLAQIAIKNQAFIVRSLNFSISYYFCSVNNGISNVSDIRQTFLINSKSGQVFMNNRLALTDTRYEYKVCAVLTDSQIEKTVLVETQLFILNDVVSEEFKPLQLDLPSKTVLSNKNYLRFIEFKNNTADSYWHSIFYFNSSDNWLYINRFELEKASLNVHHSVQIYSQKLNLTVSVKKAPAVYLNVPITTELRTKIADLNNYFGADSLRLLILANDNPIENHMLYYDSNTGLLYTNFHFERSQTMRFNFKYASINSDIIIASILLNIIDENGPNEELIQSFANNRVQNECVAFNEFNSSKSVELFSAIEVMSLKNVSIYSTRATCLNNPEMVIADLFELSLEWQMVRVFLKATTTPINCNLIELKLKISLSNKIYCARTVYVDISSIETKTLNLSHDQFDSSVNLQAYTGFNNEIQVRPVSSELKYNLTKSGIVHIDRSKSSNRVQFDLINYNLAKSTRLNIFSANPIKREVYFTRSLIQIEHKSELISPASNFVCDLKQYFTERSNLTGLNIKIESKSEFVHFNQHNFHFEVAKKAYNSRLFADYSYFTKVYLLNDDFAYVLIKFSPRKSAQSAYLTEFYFNHDLSYRSIKLRNFAGLLDYKQYSTSQSEKQLKINPNNGLISIQSSIVKFDFINIYYEKMFLCGIFVNTSKPSALFSDNHEDNEEVLVDFYYESINDDSILFVTKLSDKTTCELWNSSSSIIKITRKCDLYIKTEMRNESSENKIQLSVKMSNIDHNQKSVFRNVVLNLKQVDASSNSLKDDSEYYLIELDSSNNLIDFYSSLADDSHVFFIDHHRKDDSQLFLFKIHKQYLINKMKKLKNVRIKNFFQINKNCFLFKSSDLASSLEIQQTQCPYFVQFRDGTDSTFLSRNNKEIIRSDSLIVSLATSNILVKSRTRSFNEQIILFNKLEYLSYQQSEFLDNSIQNLQHIKFSFRLGENFTSFTDQLLFMSVFKHRQDRFFVNCELSASRSVQINYNLTQQSRKIGLNHVLQANKWYQFELEISEKVSFNYLNSSL